MSQFTAPIVSVRPDHGPERFLRVDHLGHDLRAHSVRGGAVIVTNQAIKFVLLTASTAVLARLLTPEDFGLFAMVIAVVGFIAISRISVSPWPPFSAPRWIMPR